MGLLVGVGVTVAVFLLWRLVQSHEARTQLEAAKIAVAQGEAFVTRFRADHGSWGAPKRERRLIEYSERLVAALGYSEDEYKTTLHGPQTSALHDLIEESLERGIPCRFVDQADLDGAAPFGASFPGPAVLLREVGCSAQCEDYVEFVGSNDDCDEVYVDAFDGIGLPPGTIMCPFCGGSTRPIFDEEFFLKEVAHRAKAAKVWRLSAMRFPEKLAEETRELGKYRQAMAAHGSSLEAAIADHRRASRRELLGVLAHRAATTQPTPRQ